MSASSRPAKKVLTDTLIRSLKPAATGTRYAVADALVPGFVVRVTEHGAKTYMVVGRWADRRSRQRWRLARSALCRWWQRGRRRASG